MNVFLLKTFTASLLSGIIHSLPRLYLRVIVFATAMGFKV